MKQQDRKSSQYSLLATALIQLALIAGFYFITAWQAPDPPLPVYGIELGLVMSSGVPTSSLQPSVEPVRETTDEQTAKTEATTNDASENPESTIEAETLDNQINEVAANGSEENEPELSELDPAAIKELIKEENAEVHEDNLGRLKLTENTELETEALPTEVSNPEQTPVSDSLQVGEIIDNQTESDEVTETAPIDERALFPSSGNTDQTTDSNVVLNVSGYQLSEAPKINDTSNESGSITFKILVADDGYAIPIQTVQSTLSPSVTALYRDAINQLYFEKTSAKVPPETTGTITFIIKAN